MPLRSEDLDQKTRVFLLRELELDLSAGTLYWSPHLNERGKQNSVELLKSALEHHEDAWLADQLRSRGYLKDFKQHKTPSGATRPRRVPVTAPDTLGEGEFNRYYIRGFCARVIKEGQDPVVEVYRGKDVLQPRPESEALLGKRLSAMSLLEDLRTSIGVDTALGVPSGPNSGLTVRRVKECLLAKEKK